MNKVFNIPNFLTSIRLIFAPLILPFLLVYLLPLNNLFINFILAILFVLVSLTDFFDGYLARKYKMETKLGKALDPIADKFFMSSTLIALLASGKINFLWVNLLILREFFVMGLRQIALENNFAISVTFLGKLKTTLQIIMVTIIILNPYFNGFSLFGIFEFLVILLTVGVSLLSAAIYFSLFFGKFKYY
jgi:CDP-diacylglycerol---glycerol-3-phosphate 3-phosphatidyltransferase